MGRRARPGAVRPRRHPEDPQDAAPVHPRPRARRADDRRRAAARSLPARGVDRRPLERRPPRRDPPPRDRLPRHLPRRAPAAADPGRQGPHRAQHPAAPPGRRRPATVDRAGPPARGPRPVRPQRRAARCSTCSWSARKLLSNAFLFDRSLKAACTAAGLVDRAGRPTVSAHRFRHTIGTQLAEGGARLQTIMAVLGHRSPPCR